MINIIFMGTPDFAVPSFEALVKEYNVKAVVTQPDRPKGRGKKLSFSPIKEAALKKNVEIFQPAKLKNDSETIEKLKKIAPDFIVVVAFGQILSKEVLDIPKYGCINLHASLLPKYRGAAPINWAIINGEKISGNTTMLMDEGLDTGDILLKQEVEITHSMTAEELHDILMNKGSVLLVETINKFISGQIHPKKQPKECDFYASMLNKDIAKINWNSSAEKVHNFIRGMNPWPVAYTHYEDRIMKVFSSKIIYEKTNKEPGIICDISNEGIKVACKENCILIDIIQFPGKKPLKVKEFIKGNSLKNGTILI